MDLRKLKTLIDLVSDSNVSELEITEAEGRVRIVKATPVGVVAAVPSAPVAPLPPVVQQPVAQAVDVDTAHRVKSPMVGTFYRSASPGAAEFVQLGTVVKPGDTVCIIEAMKILNEIEADRAGTITQVLAENGQAVEYGQPLFVIE